VGPLVICSVGRLRPLLAERAAPRVAKRARQHKACRAPRPTASPLTSPVRPAAFWTAPPPRCVPSSDTTSSTWPLQLPTGDAFSRPSPRAPPFVDSDAEVLLGAPPWRRHATPARPERPVLLRRLRHPPRAIAAGALATFPVANRSFAAAFHHHQSRRVVLR
jgi:hypothetical protein